MSAALLVGNNDDAVRGLQRVFFDNDGRSQLAGGDAQSLLVAVLGFTEIISWL
jgi:hypothetical protein